MPFGGMLTMGLISAGTSIAGGFLGGNKNKQTPIYTPGQTAMQGTVSDTLNKRLASGGAGYYAPAKTAAISDTNDAFSGLQQNMQRGLVGRGFGSSGKLGLNTEKLGIARAGQIGGIDAQYDQMGANFDQNTLNQALQFGFSTPGQQYQQGTPLANGLSSGMGTLGTLMGLHSMLGPGGGGFGGDSFGGAPFGNGIGGGGGGGFGGSFDPGSFASDPGGLGGMP